MARILDRLTPREKQVATLIRLGNCNKTIATVLGFNCRTAKKHVRNIFDKIGCDTRLQLAVTMYEEEREACISMAAQ